MQLLAARMNQLYISLSLWMWLAELARLHFPPRRLPYTSEINSCLLPSREEWGNYTALSDQGLIARAFVCGSHERGDVPRVRVIAVNVVCVSPNLMKDTVQTLSAVVQYECVGRYCVHSNEDYIEMYTHQFFLTCHLETNSYINREGGLCKSTSDTVILDPPTANLSTSIRLACRECIYYATAIGDLPSGFVQNPNPQGCVGMLEILLKLLFFIMYHRVYGIDTYRE